MQLDVLVASITLAWCRSTLINQDALNAEVSERADWAEQYRVEGLFRELEKLRNQQGTSALSTEDLFETYCPRNYNLDCPKGWRVDPGGTSCLAGAGYAGPGPAQMTIVTSPYDKQSLERDYRVRWPCLGGCAEDYRWPCPKQWIEMANGMCRAPGDYHGQCGPVLDTREAHADQKGRLAVDCGVSWPCGDTCQKDYSEPCPLGWEQTEVRGASQCEALASYSGPCVPLQAFVMLPATQKALMEHKCEVTWPCQRCIQPEKAWHSSCPTGWFDSDSKDPQQAHCTTDKPYYGGCPMPLRVNRRFSIAERISLEQRCGVVWPCAIDVTGTECLRDYTPLCPLGWEEEPAGVCKAPQDYTGRCAGSVALETENAVVKRVFSQHCGAPYPCRTGEGESLWRGTDRKTTGNGGFLSPSYKDFESVNGPVSPFNGTVVIA